MELLLHRVSTINMSTFQMKEQAQRRKLAPGNTASGGGVGIWPQVSLTPNFLLYSVLLSLPGDLDPKHWANQSMESYNFQSTFKPFQTKDSFYYFFSPVIHLCVFW